MGQGVGACQRGCDDLQTLGRGARSCCAKALGRRPDHRSKSVCRWDACGAIKPITVLVHLPREKGYGLSPRTKNGPALASYRAVIMTNALKKTAATLLTQLWRSLTWDRGAELSDHARFTSDCEMKVFFAAPQSPWQGGTSKNTNSFLRQYFPKGCDVSRWSAQRIQAVAHTLNNRPRKTLGWQTPVETVNKYLKSVQQFNVATMG